MWVPFLRKQILIHIRAALYALIPVMYVDAIAIGPTGPRLQLTLGPVSHYVLTKVTLSLTKRYSFPLLMPIVFFATHAYSYRQKVGFLLC